MERKIDKIFIVISIVIGAILGVLGEALYQNDIIAFNSRIPCITVYLFAFALIIGVVLLIKGLQNDSFVKLGKVMALTLAAAVAFVGCSVLFEFLYETGIQIVKKYKAEDIQYVFLVDDSASMNVSDPMNERYDAVEKIIRETEPTKKFAVYNYANETACQIPMNSMNSDEYRFDSMDVEDVDGGHTNTLTAIENVIDDVCENDRHTKMIILTDGASDDNVLGKYSNVIDECENNNVSVSAVGFGYADTVFLEKLTGDTGGTYVFSDEISKLANNVETVFNAAVSSSKANRDLLGERLDSTQNSVLYAFLRILFLTALGFIWTIIKYLLVGEKRFKKSAALITFALCALGAVLMEILTLMGVPDASVRVIFCALWACTIIPEPVHTQMDLGNILHSTQNDGIPNNLMDDFNSNSQEVDGPKSFL